MIKGAIEKILELRAPTTFDFNGETFASERLHHIRTPDEPAPPHLELNSLTGIADYLNHNVDALEIPHLYFHVVNAGVVRLVETIDPENSNRRLIYAEALARDNLEGSRSTQFDAEELIIHLRSNFHRTDDLELLMSRVGNLVHETTVSYDDDGVTPNVTVRQGLTFKKAEKLPPLVVLAPYRTFREIDQPPIPYAVRIRGGGNDGPIRIRLIDASGGAWKNEAIIKIKEWIYANTDGSVPVLA